MSVLVLIDSLADEVGRQAVTAARRLADSLGTLLTAVSLDPDAKNLGGPVDTAIAFSHPGLVDYAPAALGSAVAQLLKARGPIAVVAPGTDRGNEVLAHVAAITDAPMVANVTGVEPAETAWKLTRVRWGGSLLEECTLLSEPKLISVAPHAFPPAALAGEGAAVETFEPALDEASLVTRVVERVTRDEGITLATAPVVVSGGRGVGGPEGFAPLEELARLLGGAVGCSRVVTNNGWRPHSDQVGQTGTRVAPELYIACGISGAIQHWVGMMASKNVLAINTDPEAPMVTKADFAAIADVGELLPAIVEEVRRRRG